MKGTVALDRETSNPLLDKTLHHATGVCKERSRAHRNTVVNSSAHRVPPYSSVGPRRDPGASSRPGRGRDLVKTRLGQRVLFRVGEVESVFETDTRGHDRPGIPGRRCFRPSWEQQRSRSRPRSCCRGVAGSPRGDPAGRAGAVRGRRGPVIDSTSTSDTRQEMLSFPGVSQVECRTPASSVGRLQRYRPAGFGPVIVGSRGKR